MPRKQGSKIVVCDECMANMTVMPGEIKICPACGTKYNKTQVRQMIKKQKKG